MSQQQQLGEYLGGFEREEAPDKNRPANLCRYKPKKGKRGKTWVQKRWRKEVRLKGKGNPFETNRNGGP